jgi:hypothetical protein
MVSAVAQFSGKQHGLVTRAQALTVYSLDQLEHLLSTGQLYRVRDGVYGVTGCPQSWRQQLLAACLAAGPGAVASFRAAAALWELEGFRSDLLEITVPWRRRRRHPGVIVHNTVVTGPGHTSSVARIPVTSVARTLCDLTAVAPFSMVRHALGDARRRRLVTLRQLERVFDTLATQGRRRSTVMRELLERERDGVDPGGSDKEVDVVRWLVAAGLPRPVQQYRIKLGKRTIKVDAAYPDLKIAIEYDGWESHRQRDRFDDDRARDNALGRIGWLPLRYTSARTRQEIVVDVAAAIEERQAMQSAPKRMRNSA